MVQHGVCAPIVPVAGNGPNPPVTPGVSPKTAITNFGKFKAVAVDSIDSLITAVIGFGGGSVNGILIYIIGIGGFIGIVYTGFLFLTAGGDEKNLEKAKKSFLYIAIGLVAGTLSYSIISIVEAILKRFR